MTSLDRACDPFLDDRLNSFETARFARRLVREPRLAATVDLQRQIEGSLRRTLVVPDLDGLVERVGAMAARAAAMGVPSSRDADAPPATDWVPVPDQGMIRFVTAAATFLLMCLAMCGATVMQRFAPRVEHEAFATREPAGSLATAIGLGVCSATAVMARNGQLRRGRRGSAPRFTPVRAHVPQPTVAEPTRAAALGETTTLALLRRGSAVEPPRLFGDRRRREFRRDVVSDFALAG